MAPRPMTPSVFPGNSNPTNCFFPASTALLSASPVSVNSLTYSRALQRLRAPISMPAMASSLTAFALAPGALKTGTPLALIASMGMLLVPAPARPIAATVSGISMSCILYDRTSMASGCAISDATSYRSRGKWRSPSTAMLFSVSILYIVLFRCGDAIAAPMSFIRWSSRIPP